MKLLPIILLLFISCQKTVEKRIVYDGCSAIEVSQPEERGKPIKPKPALIWMNYNGGYAVGFQQYFTPSLATEIDKIEIAEELMRQYAGYDLTLTEDSMVFARFNGPKQEVIMAGEGDLGFLGMAIIGSMVNAQLDYPAIVWFWATRFYVNKNRVAAYVATHEIGHTIGLYHTVDTCGQQYALPINGFCPTMGNVSTAITIGWVTQINSYCIMQDDNAIISKTIKKKR